MAVAVVVAVAVAVVVVCFGFDCGGGNGCGCSLNVLLARMVLVMFSAGLLTCNTRASGDAFWLVMHVRQAMLSGL